MYKVGDHNPHEIQSSGHGEWMKPTSHFLSRYLEDAEKDEQEPREFNPIVFWSVNAIWISVLLFVIIWFWKFNGAQRITDWTRHLSSFDSDLEYRMRRQRRREREEERKKVPPDVRRKLLHKFFRSTKVHMVVGEGDIISDSFESKSNLEVDSVQSQSDAKPVGVDLNNGTVDNNRNAKADSKSSGSKVVDRSGAGEDTKPDADDIESGVGGMDASVSTYDQGFLVLQTKSGERHVPNCCAVCLAAYDLGDDVVWSDNNACRHAFHEDCVTDWLIKMQEGNPCPCCRSVFVDMDAVKPNKPAKRGFGTISL